MRLEKMEKRAYNRGVQRKVIDMRGQSDNCDVILLIPAVDPDEHLLTLLRALESKWNGPVLLVDDGSGQQARNDIFPEAERMGCTVVRHACNMGKGRALKTGFNECLNRWPDLVGVVTADADGQHLVKDICACREALIQHPDSLVLGCRDFSAENVPWKSEFGNRITRTVMRLLCGVGVSDTQTGLRGISASFMRRLLTVSGERFDFETNMLLETRTAEVVIEEVTIATVYLEQNRASHFHPLRDSLQIYALLLKFCGASLAGFLVDIGAFAAISALIRPLPLGNMAITVATVCARILSACVNYLLNHKVVFQSSKRLSGSALRYALLCVVQMMVSAALVTWAAGMLPISPVACKIVIDFLLFFVSFQIQRRWIF